MGDTKKFGFMAESGSSEEDLSANISIKPTIDLPSAKVTATLPSIDLKGAVKRNIDVSVETNKEKPKDVDLSLKAKTSKKTEQVKYTKYDEEQSTSSEDEDTLLSMRSRISKPGIKTERHIPTPEVDIQINKTDIKLDIPSPDISASVPSGKVEVSGGIGLAACCGKPDGKKIKGGADVSISGKPGFKAGAKVPTVDASIKAKSIKTPSSDVKVQGGIGLDIKPGGKKFGFMADSGSSDDEISANISVKPPVVKKPEVD